MKFIKQCIQIETQTFLPLIKHLDYSNGYLYELRIQDYSGEEMVKLG